MTDTVTRSRARTYFIKDNRSWSWGRIFVHSGRSKSGMDWAYVAIVSDFGTYGHLWNHMGEPYQDFLSSVDFDYAMNKLTEGRYLAFDLDYAVKTLRQWTLETRREGAITAEDAREFFDLLADLEAEGVADEGLFAHRLSHGTSLYHSCYLWDFSFRRPTAASRHFWGEVWLPFAEHLRREHRIRRNHPATAALPDLHAP